MDAKFLRSAFWPAVFVVCSHAGPNDTAWTSLFNHKDMQDWDVKISGQALNHDSLSTVRVADCVNDTGQCLELNYSNYTNWNNYSPLPWGRAAYKTQPFSYYYLRAEYQLFGTQTSGTPSYSMQQSAILIHSQSMASMALNQDWANTIEEQIVGPANNNGAVGTANLCVDGMEFHGTPTGALTNSHCVNAVANSMTLAPTWTSISALVLGDSIVRFYAANQLALTFYKPVQWNDSLIHNKTISIVNNTPVTGGYIGIQGEGAPIRFRKLELANLAGCMNPSDPNYKSYFIKNDTTQCSSVVALSGQSELSRQNIFSWVGNRIQADDEILKVEVFDWKGALVSSFGSRGLKTQDLSGLKPGVYAVRATTRKGSAQVLHTQL